MKFKLEFDMDNDAFQPDKCNEIVRILRDIASRTNEYCYCPEEIGEYPIKDSNGNKIGTFEITE